MYSPNKTLLPETSQETSKQHIRNETLGTYIKHLIFSDNIAVEMYLHGVFTFDQTLFFLNCLVNVVY
jgi:hypothetical protein